jgi:RNA polymerase sigma-70 factor (ECF subfamily)
VPGEEIFDVFRARGGSLQGIPGKSTQPFGVSSDRCSGRTVDEQEAIQRLKRGDPGGLEYLVLRYQVKAVRTAFLITRDPGLSEEVVQESFLRAYRLMRGFDETRPFEPWFIRSVVNAALKVMQRSGREVQIEDSAQEPAFARLAAQMESVESHAESAEVERQIAEALQELSPRQRAVIVQRYLLGMSEAEMAKENGAANGTIKWLLNAARRRLRSLLLERSDQ